VVRTGTWLPIGRLPYEKLLQAGEDRGPSIGFSKSPQRDLLIDHHAHYGPGIGTMPPFD